MHQSGALHGAGLSQDLRDTIRESLTGGVGAGGGAAGTVASLLLNSGLRRTDAVASVCRVLLADLAVQPATGGASVSGTAAGGNAPAGAQGQAPAARALLRSASASAGGAAATGAHPSGATTSTASATPNLLQSRSLGHALRSTDITGDTAPGAGSTGSTGGLSWATLSRGCLEVGTALGTGAVKGPVMLWLPVYTPHAEHVLEVVRVGVPATGMPKLGQAAQGAGGVGAGSGGAGRSGSQRVRVAI